MCVNEALHVVGARHRNVRIVRIVRIRVDRNLIRRELIGDVERKLVAGAERRDDAQELIAQARVVVREIAVRCRRIEPARGAIAVG